MRISKITSEFLSCAREGRASLEETFSRVLISALGLFPSDPWREQKCNYYANQRLKRSRISVSFRVIETEEEKETAHSLSTQNTAKFDGNHACKYGCFDVYSIQ